ncbi:MAG TPA: MBL fold metallo-hydrolase [Candidatus Limnocylindrales bacterium]|jgi:L-ascorbate metabolism protein UlaG (beta-lactamase superfamily)|nr:MBL fold metallo-hydrolase [Candidatus Limnocylindrales bacterium]
MAPERDAARDAGWRAIRAASPAAKAGPAHGRLTFLGHSTLLIEVDDLRILTDPVLREGFGPVRRQVEAVLPELFADLDAVFISHGHHDHLDQPSLRRIPGRPTVIVPRGFGRLARRWDLGPVEEVEPGDHVTIDRVRLEVTYAEHSGKREPFGPVGPAIGVVIRGSRTAYFPGDTDLFPGLEALAGQLDVALLPVWGWGPTIGEGHMDPERAAEAAAILRPRLAVPIHWGTFYPAGLRRVAPEPFETPGSRFAEAVARLAPGVPVRVVAPGEAIDLEAR